ncbi:UbiD family decarboxylase [Halarchaeum acidiphilum]|nr:UbiD family decarboxylase [Halarchaeum acidiphilum]
MKTLDEHDRLVRIEDEVALEPDVGALSRASNLVEQGGGPAILTEDLRGYPTGERRIITNVHGSWRNINLAFGLDPETSTEELIFGPFVDRRDERVEPEYVEPSDAPAKQNVVTGDDVSLTDAIPLYRNNLEDGGPYITKGVVVSKDPIEGWENLGIYRIQLKDDETLKVQLFPFHNSGRHFSHAMEAGEPLEVAVLMGLDPVTPIVASSPNEPGTDDYAMAGGIMQESVPVTDGETVDLPVHANAEYVIEGTIDPYHREYEGPMGEFTGTYSEIKRLPEMDVSAITYRDDPIFENLIPAKPAPFGEVEYLAGINTSATLYSQIKDDFPGVKSVNATSPHGLMAVVSMRPGSEGEGKTAAMDLMSTPHGSTYTKLVIVVDEDIDPFNWQEIVWSLSTRLHPGRGLTHIENAPALALDPAALSFGRDDRYDMDKMIIDTTLPSPPADDFQGIVLDPRPEVDEYVETLREMIGGQEGEN